MKKTGSDELIRKLEGGLCRRVDGGRFEAIDLVAPLFVFL